MLRALVLVSLLGSAACQTQGPTEPTTLALLIDGTAGPGLTGALAGLTWGMPLRDAEARLPRRGGLAYTASGDGTPARLSRILIREPGGPATTSAAGAAERRWGPPDFMADRGQPVWVGPNTRARFLGNELELVAMRPLTDWLGTGALLGFEGDRPMTDITADELAARFGAYRASGSTVLQLGNDERGPVDVTYQTGTDGRVDQLALTVVVPPRDLRGAAILARFGLRADRVPGAFVSFGGRQVAVRGDDESSQWNIIVRRAE